MERAHYSGIFSALRMLMRVLMQFAGSNKGGRTLILLTISVQEGRGLKTETAWLTDSRESAGWNLLQRIKAKMHRSIGNEVCVLLKIELLCGYLEADLY